MEDGDGFLAETKLQLHKVDVLCLKGPSCCSNIAQLGPAGLFIQGGAKAVHLAQGGSL